METPASRSPLPWCFAASALVGLLVVFEMLSAQLGVAAVRELSVPIFGGILAGALGMLLRESRRWIEFVAGCICLGLGCGFAAQSFRRDDLMARGLIPMVLATAVLAAIGIALQLGTIFWAHRRLLEARPGSLLHHLAHRGVWSATVGSIAAACLVVTFIAPPTGLRTLVTWSGLLLLMWLAWARARTLKQLQSAIRSAERRLDDAPSDADVTDLGLGEELWRDRSDRSDRSPYRRSLPARIIRGSLELSKRHARWVGWHDGLAGVVALAAMVVGLFTLGPVRATAPESTVPVQQPAQQPALTFRQGSWYSEQSPILTDIDGDGTEDVIGLRWDSSEPERALFAGAYRGDTLEPLWTTEPVASQWASPDTKLLLSDSVVFLLNSEREVRVHNLATGRLLYGPAPIEGATCATQSAPPRLWLHNAPQDENGYPGTILTDTGQRYDAPRPADCSGDAGDSVWFSDLISAKSCRDKLETPEMRWDTWWLKDSLGFGLAVFEQNLRVSRFDPKTCQRSWTIVVTKPELLHHRPQRSHRFSKTHLYSLYQLASGSWEVNALNLTTGNVSWRRALPQAKRGTNVRKLFVSSQRVYVLRDWGLDVFAIDDGRQVGRL